MRFVFVPEELTTLHLLEFWDVHPVLADMFQEQMRRQFEKGLYEETLALIDPILSTARAKRDHYTAALALLYKADILRRLQRWEDALEHTQGALGWLRMQVTQIARYDEAIACYLEGLIHFVLKADDKAVRTFVDAQKLLEDSERYWRFEGNYGRAADCQNVNRWMKNLLELRPTLAADGLIMIMPVYRQEGDTFVQTQVLALSPFDVVVPGEVLREYLPPKYIPIEMDFFYFLYLHPDAHYVALKILADGYLVKESQTGDILLVEMVAPAAPTKDLILSQDEPFVRTAGSHILFRPLRREAEGFVGIPRVLIREEEGI